jgi:hypothetical protein|tara:strand:+ start:612 stop:827 length:216 start_codon:yes stop_codon:yes gene_type:complete
MPYQSYHSFYLTLIQKIVKASFVGWVDEKGVKSLKMVIIGVKEPKYLPFEGNITQDTYTDLIEKLTRDVQV